MLPFFSRVSFAAFCSAATLALPAPALAATPLESESFPVGTEGALCEAQGVMLGSARTSVFDRKWALICSDVDRPVGAAFSWRAGGDASAWVGRGRDALIECGEATSASDIAAGAVVRRCREQGSNLEWNSYAVKSGDRVLVVEGVAAFDSALRLAMANLVQNRIVPGTLDIVTTGGSGSLAQARAGLGGQDLLIGQGYRRNNAGEYTEAEEFFRPGRIDDTSQEGAATIAAQRHETMVNRALQLSNLGRFDEATRLFGEARAMGLRDPIQPRLLRNFEAIDALNRGDLAAVAPILARPVPDVAQPVAANDGAVLIDTPLSAGLNSGLAASLTDSVQQETRLTLAERAAIIDAQARQIGGTALRLRGENDAALAELTAARDDIMRIKGGRVLSAARLQAQILAEMSQVHEAAGRYGQAEGLLRDAVALTERRYPESASVTATKARLAAFLSRRGERAQSLALYRELVSDVTGKRAALVGLENQVRPFMRMLVEDVQTQPALVSELFLASQLVERPGAAQTLAQLSRQLSAGTDEASDLFRRANTVDRELTRVNLSIAQARAPDDMGQGEAAALLPELEDRRARLEQAQIELIEALGAYPEYRSISHNYVAADDLVALLKPDEAYLKLVRLGDEMFAVYLSPTRSTGWRVDASAGQVAGLVQKLRDSIALSINGVTATYPFDVDSSRQLYRALFGPDAADLGRVEHLIFEPDGALLQLPINLLVADQAGVDAYHARVAAGGDEFDFRGVNWLGRDKAISTALSPAGFRDARRAPSSRAAKAYLGLGQNEPIGPVTQAALTRGLPQFTDPGCALPVASWNRPIPSDELVAASEVFGAGQSTLLTRAAFNDTAIERRGDLNSFRILHFATHAVVTPPREGCPAQPALVTSFGDQGSDGLLQFGEVFDLNLDADLVILSACDTASTAGLEATREAGLENGGGQALDGLVRAFIGAGGRQVIASHWPAPEQYEATGRLFASFFRAPAGTSQGDALLAAQRLLMDDPATSHPFYWSGFALIGDGSRPLFSGS
jgi:CHAT domain-containing protein